MRYLKLLPVALICICTSCTHRYAIVTQPRHEYRSTLKTIEDFQSATNLFSTRLTLPDFELTPEEITTNIRAAMKDADAGLDAVGALKPDEVTFANTVGALDDIGFDVDVVSSRIYLLKETSTDEAMRNTATEAIKEFQDWAVGTQYREDVYQAVKAYADTNPKLIGEDRKLLEETLRDYRRAGFHLSKAERDEVEALKKELAGLSTDFRSNVTQAEATLVFSKGELEGVSADFLNTPGVKTEDGEFAVKANVTWHYLAVMENAVQEETRKKLKNARYSLAGEKNEQLLNDIVGLRNKIAKKLGYKSWADYQIEPRMAKDGQTAFDFLTNLKDGLKPKFDAEVEEFRKLKAAETENPDAEIHLWDWRYYSNQLKKEKYTVDTEQLKVYFPYEETLNGMFRTYETIFGLKIEQIKAPYKWVDGLTLHVVSDSLSKEPLGAFYLDMFPREGKYNHFAQFGIIPGKQLSSGEYQRPVVALICNFPSAAPGKPSLLSHSHVETLFHEFGHALHSILTRAKYDRFSGTSVPRDFVEAPSQMLENWVWDKESLDSFAADYRDSSKKIPAGILQKMEAARLATIGTFYRRQLSFGLLDLHLHRDRPLDEPVDAVAESNAILSDVFFPVPDGTTFVTYFGHLTGYDAGYYGYAWADAISADMNTVFEEAPGRYFDTEIGRRLRDEIYAPGGSRDANDSIRAFLKRDRSLEPFLKSIGIEGE